MYRATERVTVKLCSRKTFDWFCTVEFLMACSMWFVLTTLHHITSLLTAEWQISITFVQWTVADIATRDSMLQLRYDNEMQQYLIANGLQASDLSKSKKKKDSKEKLPAASAASSTAPTQPLVTLTPEQMAEEMARTILESAGICADPAALSNLAGDTSLGDEQLPSFSQVWSGADTIAPAQLCLSTDQSFCGTGNTVPPSTVPSATSQPATICRLESGLAPNSCNLKTSSLSIIPVINSFISTKDVVCVVCVSVCKYRKKS